MLHIKILLKVKAVARDNITGQGVFYIKIFTTVNFLFISAFIFSVKQLKTEVTVIQRLRTQRF